MDNVREFLEFLSENIEFIQNNAWFFSIYSVFLVTLTWPIAWFAFKFTHRKQLNDSRVCEELEAENTELRKRILELTTDDQILKFKNGLTKKKPKPINIRFFRSQKRK